MCFVDIAPKAMSPALSVVQIAIMMLLVGYLAAESNRKSSLCESDALPLSYQGIILHEVVDTALAIVISAFYLHNNAEPMRQ